MLFWRINMFLSEGRKNCSYIVEDINLREETKQRLQMLGLTAGTSVLILNRKRSGAMIIKIRGTRFAIGQKISEGITIGGVV
jgi:ferrous iron transport protein A